MTKRKRLNIASRRIRWINALEENKYSQLEGQLKGFVDEEDGIIGHCCLGVACEILSEEDLVLWEGSTAIVIDPQADDEMTWADTQDSSLLPSTALPLLGISEQLQRALAHLNDNNVSFAVIAGFLRNLWGYETAAADALNNENLLLSITNDLRRYDA